MGAGGSWPARGRPPRPDRKFGQWRSLLGKKGHPRSTTAIWRPFYVQAVPERPNSLGIEKQRAGEGSRTPDLFITSELLCQLSYPGGASILNALLGGQRVIRPKM